MNKRKNIGGILGVLHGIFFGNCEIGYEKHTTEQKMVLEVVARQRYTLREQSLDVSYLVQVRLRYPHNNTLHGTLPP